MAAERPRIIKTFGLKPIHIATIRGQKAAVCALLRAGTNVDEATKHGITPLMLGALFGHLALVCLLIKHGAGRSVQDASKRMAREYSWSSSTLVRTGWNTFEKLSNKLTGRCYSADVVRRRKRIWKILRRRDTFRGFLEGASQPHGTSAFSISSTGEVTLWKKVTSVHNGSGRNDTTPAIIARTEKKTIIQWAFSGWTTDNIVQHVVNSQEYTQLVVAFCQSSGFTLSANARDNPGGRITDPELIEAEQGRWQACHAEKKLAIFYLRLIMHRTFKNDFQDPLDSGYEFKQEQIRRLKSMKIPNDRRKAYIFLGHEACDGCLDFLHHLQKVTGIEILVKTIPIMEEYNRPEKRYGDSAADNQQSPHSDDDGDDKDNDSDDTESTMSNESEPRTPAMEKLDKQVFTRADSPQMPGVSEKHPAWDQTQKPPRPTPILVQPGHWQLMSD
ncbi:uncharacterized protein PgNI_01277 [Pyricularia grisea]|uniref:Single-strand DNA deaminase toxin A-like C-terminal domain-containing protein n=1 Tax=Pyricularia grisea TaxID=148305 RepID=A0A6P8BIN3_PYRGI|nr:uncharacterized protein PgNI_01277 [Pyricularia grisea]TLD16499.1 hypothetical protein PgNI_01277 [Pyricularia grisea]